MPLTRDAELPAAGAGDRLGRGVLNTSELVFMVMAAAAPMAVVVALMPMAFAFGNGVGVPGTYVGAMIAMLLFAVGYVQIIPHVRNAGAFYAYISASFGRTCGLAAAYVAAISYFALCCSTLGALAFFSAELCKRISGLDIRWEFWAALSIAAVSYLAYRRITLAAKVLSIALGAEILLLGILDVAIVHYRGLGDFTAQPFRPSVVFAPGFGIAAIYAFNGLIGVEGTAIYQEEARDRTRTVPRATYLSVIAIGSFYVLTSWCLVVGVGPGRAIAGAARSDPGHFVVGQITNYLGNVGGDLLSWLVVTSSFAAVLALFNNGARYVYALSRDGVLPRALAKTHARYQSPYLASGVLTLLLAVVIAFSSIARPRSLAQYFNCAGRRGISGAHGAAGNHRPGYPGVFCQTRRVEPALYFGSRHQRLRDFDCDGARGPQLFRAHRRRLGGNQQPSIGAIGNCLDRRYSGALAAQAPAGNLSTDRLQPRRIADHGTGSTESSGRFCNDFGRFCNTVVNPRQWRLRLRRRRTEGEFPDANAGE